MMLTGFIVGIPLFYNVGFVLLVPLVFSITYKTGLPAVYTALPMLAALSVTHGFLPPHPSPSAIAIQLHADPGKVLLYGILIAIPAMIIAGPVFAKTVKGIIPQTPSLFQPIQHKHKHKNLPGAANSFLSSLMPALLLVIVTIILSIAKTGYPSSVPLLTFLGDPIIILLLSVLLATWSLGTSQGMGIKTVMNFYSESVKDVAMILLIVAGSGALKQILIDSGVSAYLGEALKDLSLNPLLLGWLAAAVIRVCVGSATVAGLTAAGVIAPLIATTGTNANLMVLSIGAGSLMFSHVNDSGFWMFKEYFNLTLKDTLRSWSVMETIVSVMGLLGVLLLEVFLK
jgi:Gnt-I system high-affinity gluconate transporter